MFRRVFQVLGAGLVAWCLANAIQVGLQMLDGSVSLAAGFFELFLLLGCGVGFGILMIIYSPHKIIQFASGDKLYRLARHRTDSRSFSERIGVGDDE